MTLLDHLPSLRHAYGDRLARAIWPSTSTVDTAGRLCIGGVPLTDIADEFGTPAYVVDEADFRGRIRNYRKALPGVRVVYAGKSLLTTTIARWVDDEGLALEVCSGGELATALTAGVDPSLIVLHGNAKSIDELRAATTAGVGRIVVDSTIEIDYLAGLVRRPQLVLIRTTPALDQQFGFTVADGQLRKAVARVVKQPLLALTGLHCHIGSQVTDAGLYGEAIARLVPVLADIRATHGITLTELNIGGGHGIPYQAGDPELDLHELSAVIDETLDECCAAARLPRPTIVVEPGRAISARAGVTVYRVAHVKSRPGGRTFVTVDGGMSDTPGVARYGATSTVALANRHSLGPVQPMTVVGRHGDSGDELARGVPLPADLHAGDVLAVACTGAYHHSMASNYSGVTRPPVVAVRRGVAHELVRRETVADVLARDRGVTAD